MGKKLDVFWKRFSELATQELYDILQLREAVFQIEQQCLYPDLDSQDQGALHLLVYSERKLVGYLRLFTPDSAENLMLSSEQAGAYSDRSVCRFGRFVVHQDYRGTGVAKYLMQLVLDYCEQHYPTIKISIAAQEYLERFYRSFGFVTQGSPYDDFGVMHVDMEK